MECEKGEPLQKESFRAFLGFLSVKICELKIPGKQHKIQREENSHPFLENRSAIISQ